MADVVNALTLLVDIEPDSVQILGGTIYYTMIITSYCLCMVVLPPSGWIRIYKLC